jgi:hypothetical protein
MSELVIFERLLGQTFDAVTAKVQGDAVLFKRNDEVLFKLHHEQDCCESVWLEDIVGDLDDLIGTPITRAEKVTNRTPGIGVFIDAPPPEDEDEEPESYTWTYIWIGTSKGTVAFRWYGTSNGYYSEDVNLWDSTKEEED